MLSISKKKRSRSKSGTPREKRRRHSIEGALRSPAVSPTSPSTSNQRQPRRNTVSPDAASLNFSPGSRLSARIQEMNSPQIYMQDKYETETSTSSNTAKTAGTFDEIECRSEEKITQNLELVQYLERGKKLKVEPCEFICLYDVGNSEGIPNYIRQAKKNSPVLETRLKSGPYLRRASFHNEQKERLKCLGDCIEAMMNGLQLQGTTWFDTTSVLSDRIENCKAIVEKYGFEGQFEEVVPYLRNIYVALLIGWDNGIGRNAMFGIFEISHLLLKGKSQNLTMNLGGSSSKNDANSHFIKILCDLDRFDERHKEEIITELMSGEEIQGEHQQAIPDVAMFTFSNLNMALMKWYLFGECKLETELYSCKILAQVFEQSLRGLVDYNSVCGCGFTHEGVFLSKMEIKPSLNQLHIKRELFYFQDDFVEEHFNCDKFLDMIICLSHIVQLHEIE